MVLMKLTRPAGGLMLLTALLGGCAANNQYNYAETDIELPITGYGKLGLAVIDARPYVASGLKNADFVGLQRGRYAYPFDVTTSTGAPLAQDIQSALSNALSSKGFEVIGFELLSVSDELLAHAISASGARRSLVLTIREWKTDALVNFGLHYDMELKVYDESGRLLAEKSTAGHEKLGWARRESRNSDAATASLGYRLGLLISSPDIEASLD